ncbi:MAG TPA: methylated-DNA--[protein]-cysteine S-methyltransferase [Burkholderiaceae bacterium]|nr:methylated-DNA--[protein]-cysteine S-methyltransferase [Burkholderiaceae bacterium]
MEPLYAHSLDSPLGTIHLRIDTQGRLVALDFDDGIARTDAVLAKRRARLKLIESATLAREITMSIKAYFEGDVFAIDMIDVHAHGTPFQQSCWQALRRIPAGQTCSYLDEARAIGRATAIRAVGRANGANPIPIVVPCHRVIASDGSLGGYSAGLQRKVWLLDHERRYRSATARAPSHADALALA